MIGEILKWIRDTEIYKDDKLWQLFCSVFPSIEVIVGWIFAFFQWKSKSKLDIQNKQQIKELEAKFEKQLMEKENLLMYSLRQYLHLTSNLAMFQISHFFSYYLQNTYTLILINT